MLVCVLRCCAQYCSFGSCDVVFFIFVLHFYFIFRLKMRSSNCSLLRLVDARWPPPPPSTKLEHIILCEINVFCWLVRIFQCWCCIWREWFTLPPPYPSSILYNCKQTSCNAVAMGGIASSQIYGLGEGELWGARKRPAQISILCLPSLI